MALSHSVLGRPGAGLNVKCWTRAARVMHASSIAYFCLRTVSQHTHKKDGLCAVLRDYVLCVQCEAAQWQCPFEQCSFSVLNDEVTCPAINPCKPTCRRRTYGCWPMRV